MEIRRVNFDRLGRLPSVGSENELAANPRYCGVRRRMRTSDYNLNRTPRVSMPRPRCVCNPFSQHQDTTRATLKEEDQRSRLDCSLKAIVLLAALTCLVVSFFPDLIF